MEVSCVYRTRNARALIARKAFSKLAASSLQGRGMRGSLGTLGGHFTSFFVAQEVQRVTSFSCSRGLAIGRLYGLHRRGQSVVMRGTKQAWRAEAFRTVLLRRIAASCEPTATYATHAVSEGSEGTEGEF